MRFSRWLQKDRTNLQSSRYARRGRAKRGAFRRFESLEARHLLAFDPGTGLDVDPAAPLPDDGGYEVALIAPSASPSPDPAAVLAQVRAAISELEIDSLENLGTVQFAPQGTIAPVSLAAGVHVLRPGYGSSFGPPPAPIGWTVRNTLLGGVLTPIPIVPGSFNARLVSYESPQVIDTAVILAKEVVFDGDVLELSDNITQFIVVAETIRSSPGSTIRWEGAGLTAPNHGTTIPPVAPIGAPNWDPHDGTGGTFDRRNGGNGFDGAAHTTSGEILRYSFPNGNTPSVFSGNAELAAVNDSYNGMRIEFTSGDLAGQWSTISDYSAFLRRITVTSAFSETPAKTDTFRIIHDFRAKTGNIGRSAPDVIFYVKHFTRELNISGTAHTYQASLPDLDLRGERGGRGQTGQAGGPGGDGAKGLRADSGTFDCQRGPGYGGHGGDGGNGGPGGHGGAGGAGGDILVQYVEFPADTNLQAASMLTLGGARGLGGAGGAGGPGGEGGDAGNPDDPWCDARPGRAGDDGQPGAAGPAGSLGAPGQLAQKTFAPIPLSTWEEAFTKPYLVRAEDAHVTETVVFETLNICGPDTSCPAPHLIARDDLDGSMHTFFLDAIAPDRYNWTIPDSMDAGTYTVFIRRADTKETNTYRVEVLPLVEEIWLAEEFDARPAGTAYLVGLGLRPDVEIVYDGVRILPEVLYDSSSPNAEQPPPDESPAARDLIQFTIPLLATSGNYFSRDNGQTPHTIYLDQPFPLANSDPVSLTLKRTDGMKFLPSVNGFDFPNGEMFAEVQDWVGRDGFLGGLFGSDGLGGRAYDAFRDVYGQGEIDALGGTANPIVWANFGLWYSYMVNPFRPNNKGFGYGACFGLATLSLHDFFEGIATEDGKTVDELARGISVIHGRQNSDEIQLLQVAETVLDAVSTAIGGPTMTEIAARYIAGFFRQANDGDGLRYAPVMSFIPSSGAYADVLVQTVNLIGETINLWDGISPQESYEDLLGAFNTLKSAFERSHTVTPYRVVYDDPADTLPSRIYFYDNNIPGSPGNDIYLDIYREGGRVKFKYTGHYATDPHPSPDEDLDTPGGFMLSVVPIGLPLGNVDMLLDFGQSIWGTHIEETVGIYNTVRLLLDASQFLGEIPGIDVESQQISSAGTVRFVDQDGGFYGIVADNGVRFEPLALTTEFQVDGLRVHFAGATQPEQGPQSHHWGIPLSVNLIEAINELPAAPTVTGPAAVTAGTTPEITWTAVEAAARYELQVTDLATSQTVIQAPSVAGTSLTPGTPLTAGHYRVLVRGINNLSEAGQWSAPYDFEIALATSTPGDFDHDGAVNDQDIDVLLAEITLGMNRTLYDLTGDLWVDAADATYLVETILATHFGDANLDGLVDAADAAILAANFGWTGGAAWRRGNFNGDAAVDLVDLAMQQSHFGLGDPMASPPAPQAVLATQPAPHARANARRNDTVTIRAARHPAQPTIPRPPAATSGASTSQPVASTLIGRRAARRPRPSPAEPSRSLTARVPLTTRVVDSLFAEPG